MSGYFKRMTQLAQLSAASASHSRHVNHSAQHETASTTSRIVTDPIVGREPAANLNVNTQVSTPADTPAVTPVDTPVNTTANTTVNTTINETLQSTEFQGDSPVPFYTDSILDEPVKAKSRYGSDVGSKVIDGAASENTTAKQTIINSDTLTEYRDDGFARESVTTRQTDRNTNRETANTHPAVTQSTPQSELFHTPEMRRSPKPDSQVELSVRPTPKTCPNQSKSYTTVGKALPPPTQPLESPIPQTTNKNNSNTLANDVVPHLQPPGSSELIEHSNNKLRQSQDPPSRLPSPAAPPQASTKVDVKIGSITLSVEPEPAKTLPQKTVLPARTSRTNGIWSGGRTFSRAYLRRS